MLVGHQVGDGEAVVRGDVVDGRDHPAQQRRVGVAEQVRRAGQAGRQVPHAVPGAAVGGLGGVAQPERPDGVAEPVVPLRQRCGEAAGPPAARAQVPRLGDQLEVGQHRVGLQRHEERVLRGEAVRVPSEGDHEVEPVAVHADPLGPPAQRVQGELHHPRPAEVQAVAAPGDVGEPGRRRPVVQVVDRRVQAAPGQVGPVGAALAGVVVDHVEHHLEARRVQRLDGAAHLLQHRRRPGLLRRAGGVARVRGEEAERVVAPVVGAALAHQPRLRGDRVDRQQLEGGHPEVGQVGDGRGVARGPRRSRAARAGAPPAAGSDP